MGRRRRLNEPEYRRDYTHGLLTSFPCLAIRMHWSPVGRFAHTPPFEGEACAGQMSLQPVVAQQDEWTMLSYRCGKCGRVAWLPTYDARLPSEEELS